MKGEGREGGGDIASVPECCKLIQRVTEECLFACTCVVVLFSCFRVFFLSWVFVYGVVVC